ncbi:MAG: AAA family ATPase [Acidobacteria bacterium]|nr:AAA family ATPase [Acidobacteriota bacterium]
MHIREVHVVNFRCFKGRFDLELTEGTNIIVGDNDAGKSTIIEAINMALSGTTNGRFVSTEINQYMFNSEIVEGYLARTNNGENTDLPEITIEIVFSDDAPAILEGNGNLDKTKSRGIALHVGFDTDYSSEYQALITGEGEITTLPIEYYRSIWTTFARDIIGVRSIPMKAAIIDTTAVRFHNGADIYISRIVRDHLSESERVKLAQAYRKMRESFIQSGSIEAINAQISKAADVPENKLTVSTNLTTKSAWETILSTYLDNIPFQQIGKGTQSIVKTKLALARAPGKKPNVILLEEPECHLTHANLNTLLSALTETAGIQQVVVSTHSSFVANKLGIDDLILLHRGKTIRFSSLQNQTRDFFRKLPGFDTLRMLLCKRVVLVEGPSDELVFQRAYMDATSGRLPIQDGIDVMSVALTFKRFLEIGRLLHKPMGIITDNDGNHVKNVIEKFKEYDNMKYMRVFADNRDSLPTLEPQIVDANVQQLDILREILGITAKMYPGQEEVSTYMQKNKVQSALAVFDAQKGIKYPKYIEEAVAWCRE